MSSLQVNLEYRDKLLQNNEFRPNTRSRGYIRSISGFELFKFIDKYLFVPVTRGIGLDLSIDQNGTLGPLAVF